VVFAAASLARPSAVRGPVLFPPCDRHRPFAIAGAWQAQPVVRAFAPQRGARLGLPRGLPLRSGPSRPPGRSPVAGCCTEACPGIATLASGTAVVGGGAVIGVICDPECQKVSLDILTQAIPSALAKLPLDRADTPRQRGRGGLTGGGTPVV
jgi:hypothetical protein